MASVTGFTVASFLCGLAPNLPLLVIFRIIQGATGGALQPLSQAVLLEAFPPQERGKAMGFWGLGIVVAPILGPVLGGWLTDNYSWRWVFYINLPVGIASLVMTQAVHLRSAVPAAARPTKIDYWGIGMLRVGIGALQIVLDKGQEDDWFSSHVHHGAGRHRGGRRWSRSSSTSCEPSEPVVDLRVFKERSYAVGVFLMTMLGFVLYGSLVLLPIMLQTLLGYPSLQAGIAMAPRGIGLVVHDADRRAADRQGRSAQAAGASGCVVGGVHAALARAAEPAGRLLGHLLAAVPAGRSACRCSSCR